MRKDKNRVLTIGIDASRAFVADPAGPEYYSLNLIHNIAKTDNYNHYILYLRKGQTPSFKLPPNFEAKELPLRYLWTQVGLAVETIIHPPDILFIPAHTLPLLTRFLLPHMPILVTIHGLEGKFLPQSGNLLSHFYRNWSISWSVRFATHLIAVSEDTKSDVIKTYQISSKGITLIHEGVDFDKFSKIDPKKVPNILEKYRIKGKYILFVGTVQPRKNLVRLIRAVSGIGIKLVVAGKLGWTYNQVLKLGIREGVIFTGRVNDEDLPYIYKGAELFVLPSLTEGFGLPILEAQAAGVPVLASNKGALPEIAGKGALYVNPLSVEEIKDKIKEILKNPNVRGELIKEGSENARNFSWRKAAGSTIKLFAKIVNQG